MIALQRLNSIILRRQGLAWTYVHLLHGAVTYPLLHWNKGSPVQLDQGRYDGLTFWEQMDDGVQHTATRKFFTAVPARPLGGLTACNCMPVPCVRVVCSCLTGRGSWA